jgi:hypothetical protein
MTSTTKSAREKACLLAEYATSLLTPDQAYVVVVFDSNPGSQTHDTWICHNISTGLLGASNAIKGALLDPETTEAHTFPINRA